MVVGYRVSQVVATIAKLGVPDLLAKGARSADDLANATSSNADALNRLMRASVTVGLCTETAPRTYALTSVGECLRSDSPGSMRSFAIAQSGPGHWLPWGHLHEAIKTGRSSAKDALGTDLWAHYDKNREEGAHFSAGMSNMSATIVAQVVPVYDFSRFERIVDVGGSQGALLAAVLGVAPRAKGIIVDLPNVIATAKEAVSRAGLSDCIECVLGDFFKEVPAGDLYLCKSVLHDWDDAQSKQILDSIHRSAKPSAKLLLVEMLVPTRAGDSRISLMDLNMLVVLDGRERNEPEFGALLAGSGWKLDRVIPTKGLPIGVIEATRA